MNQEGRLRKANEWASSYCGRNIIKAYAKWFAVDWLCALRELKLAGVQISVEEEQKLVVSYNARVAQKRREKELRKAKLRITKIIDPVANEFGLDVVIGYTSAGFPYGVTFELESGEPEEIPYCAPLEEDDDEGKTKTVINHRGFDDLPF